MGTSTERDKVTNENRYAVPQIRHTHPFHHFMIHTFAFPIHAATEHYIRTGRYPTEGSARKHGLQLIVTEHFQLIPRTQERSRVWHFPRVRVSISTKSS